MEGSFDHKPVLLKETMDMLAPRPGGLYVDCTMGGGGHAYEIIKRAMPGGKLLALDQDAAAIAAGKEKLAQFGQSVQIIKANFSQLAQVAKEVAWGQVNGILFDIGVSSYQLDEKERGFSYMNNGPLDMRMDATANVPTAADIINKTEEKILADLIYQYGEERYSRRIAKRIVEAREIKPITTTRELVELIRGAIPSSNGEDQHPAKRTFQALRIAVNNELKILEKGLMDAFDLLAPGGRLAVITFHSLEDRIVKEMFRQWGRGCICPPEMPICTCNHQPEVLVLTRKPIIATKEEIEANPRARSAKLRVAEKI